MHRRRFLISLGALAAVAGAARPSAAAATNFSVINNGMSTWLINGQSNPTLTLTKGPTYTFTIDPAAVGHPFWIATARGAGDTEANQWSQGVTGNGGGPNPPNPGVVTFVVPASAPPTLFYQCGFHDTMGGTLTIVAPAATSVPAFGPASASALAALLLAVAIPSLRRQRRQRTMAAMRDSDQ
jgi:hypothetical protein